jgi:hypothetical protein
MPGMVVLRIPEVGFSLFYRKPAKTGERLRFCTAMEDAADEVGKQGQSVTGYHQDIQKKENKREFHHLLLFRRRAVE